MGSKGGPACHIILSRLYHIDVTVFLPINLINMVLRHLPIDGHSRPVELLGGPADIPIGGDEDRKQRMSLVQGKVFGIPEPPAEVLGQVHEGNSAVADVCDRNL